MLCYARKQNNWYQNTSPAEKAWIDDIKVHKCERI